MFVGERPDDREILLLSVSTHERGRYRLQREWCADDLAAHH
jgi:hypothetical protein